MREGETTIVRHADKGAWKIDEAELRQRLTEEEANLVMSTLQTEFPDLKETPLKIDGLVRSLRLGDELFNDAAERERC